MLVNLAAMPGLPRANGPLSTFGDFPGVKVPAELPPVDESISGSPESNNATAGEHFAELLQDAIASVNQQDLQARKVAFDFATGKDIDPHAVMIASSKAETELHLTSGVATKVAQGFQTLMNMQV